jgi:DNA-binding transcriptional LysR family regulator
VLQGADRLFSRRLRSAPFDAAASEEPPSAWPPATTSTRCSCPRWWPTSSAQAPGVQLELMPLTREYDYRRHLAHGDVDLVIGNWLRPPEELHLGRLISDEVVCLVASTHPAGAPAARWTVQSVPGLRACRAHAAAPRRRWA